MGILEKYSGAPIRLAPGAWTSCGTPVKGVLTLSVGREIAAAAEVEALKRESTVGIVVVDGGGQVIALERLDCA
jgi:hypothetical protein